MSTATSPLLPESLVNAVATSVADAVRASYQAPPGLTIDDAMAKTVADSAADRQGIRCRTCCPQPAPSDALHSARRHLAFTHRGYRSLSFSVLFL
uniref:Uncharacterized protein n=1 Tax=Oryza meridionalis TaxID=40149 RepID=A0A0E0EME7_9ORYZ